MKQNKFGAFRARIEARGLDAVNVAIVAGAFIVGLLLLLFLGPGAAIYRGIEEGADVGKVAERDIIADRDITYIDEKATALRLEAEERLVLPIFVVDEQVESLSMERFRAYQDLVLTLSANPYAADSLYFQVQSEFPGVLPKNDLVDIAGSPLKSQVFSNADAVLRRVFEDGVVALPSSGLENYNPDYVELRRWSGGRLQNEDIPSSKLTTLKNIGAAVDGEVVARRLPDPLAKYVGVLVKSFVAENAFFDAQQSKRRLDSVRLRVDPIVRTIARGDHIIRKGFVVTESDFARLEAALSSSSRADWGKLLGDAGLYALFFALMLILLGKEVSGVTLSREALILAIGAALVFFAAAIVISRFVELSDPLYLAIFLPAALCTLLLAILVGQRFALLYGLGLSFLVLLASGLDVRPFAFTLVVAEAGAFAVRKALSRIDLVRAGTVIALVAGLTAAILAAPGARTILAILGPAAAGFVNGFLCGVLSLALLPVIEQALNAPTRFRLMELSDLNAPILKRLLTVAPGTYSHSVTVAHLAESACREIGADPLIARVGAYYHDIGKIEQPEYFVENQAGYNKHDEINPRLSSTVIRSHVKLGVEKARALGLPEEVIAVIAEHHGNSRINYFYNQALKDDPEAKAEDFSYPGLPPSSRESAVVMLADTVEAATRTLKRPTVSRLEDFIKELVMEKVRQGQLDDSDLTFKDLEVIRASFARILAGHFHSRIEYPKVKGEPR
jgi:putative nucleotidyltransferase with HDIG domain